LATLMFAAVSIFAERLRVPIGEGTYVSAGFLADFLSAALLGPLAGAFVAASGALASHEKGQATRTIFCASAFSIAGGACGVVFHLVSEQSLGPSGVAVAVAGVAAGATYQLLDYSLFVPIMWLRRRVGPRRWFDETFAPYLPFHLFFLLLSLGLIYIARIPNQGREVFVLFFLPVLGLMWVFRSFARQKELSESLERFSMQMAASMITALDLKDNYTAQHSAAVAQYSLDLAKNLGLKPRERSLAHLAGLLHDLGKISVPDKILNSRERLGDDAWDVVRGHSVAGQNILSNMSEFKGIGLIVLHHHERFDGGGYPHGLAGDEIPLISRIVSVADCYSAMVSDRPYRDKMSPQEAKVELASQSGVQFDPHVVAAFIDILEAGTDEYRRAEHIDFLLQFQKVRSLGDFA
jgi:putative nucleotidyltransferase with HDIG domain